MDYGRILTRAWEITWRWKVLWVLGFFAGLGNASRGFSNSSYRSSAGPTSGTIPNINFPSYVAPFFVGLACLLFIVVIALWVLSVIARGGLIAGVAQVEDEGSTTLGSAWAVGVHRFWTLFGIAFLTILPTLLLVLLVIIGLFATLVPWFAVTGTGDISGGAGQGPLVALLIFFGCTCVCGIVFLSLALEQVRIYAERAAILDGLNWTAAFARGWHVLRDHLGPTLILWLIFLVLALAFLVLTALILLPVLLPLFAIAGRNGIPNAFLPVLCGGGLIAVLVGAVINSIVEVFTSASWTLAYRSLTGRAPLPPAAPEPAPVAPPPPFEG